MNCKSGLHHGHAVQNTAPYVLIQHDPHVENVPLPVRDGIMLAYKMIVVD